MRIAAKSFFFHSHLRPTIRPDTFDIPFAHYIQNLDLSFDSLNVIN